MLTAEKQVSQVLGCSITQARYSQPYLTSFLWHPPAYWDICTLNPSAFSNAWQTHCGQDGCDTSVPVCEHLLDLKILHINTNTKKITMLTSAKILLISILSSLLLFGSHGEEGQKTNTTESSAEDLKTRGNQSVPLESKANLTSDKENRETSNPKASNFSFEDPSNKTHEASFYSNLSTDNSSRSPGLLPTPSPRSPSIHSFVSKLPWNSSIADNSLLPVSAPPNTTVTVSSENFTQSSINDTMKAPDNSSITVSNLPSGPNTIYVTPMVTDGWSTTTRESVEGFTVSQETTLHPTLKFTNHSKIFPNTSDPQEENRNTGVVFGAILGAILGASLLSLVGYLLCGKRKTDSFSHRRLYDDRNEPVLRLDNAPEPYDVSFGNSSYYNPTANDSSTSAGGENAHDGIPMDDIPPLRTSV